MSLSFKRTDYGLCAVGCGRVSPSDVDLLVKEKPAELELNYAKGWTFQSLEFLQALTHLKRLKIVNRGSEDIDPIHVLSELRFLQIETYCKTPIRFDCFPKLEECIFEWRPKSESLFDRVSLISLFVNGFKGIGTSGFGNLRNLESLGILNSSVKSLDGLRHLSKLRNLRLANLRGIDSIEPLTGLLSLEHLDINSCKKITTIEGLENLRNLQTLSLNNLGEIDSLAPLRSLEWLDRVTFWESTNIVDGDLHSIARQPPIRLAFQDRNHYSHRCDAISRKEPQILAVNCEWGIANE